MELIDKFILVAEIKRQKDEYLKHCKNKFHAEWSCGTLDNILRFIDTLEVKEVDLEKEYKDFVEEDPVYNKLVNGIVGKAIAKHFFELGLKCTKRN